MSVPIIRIKVGAAADASLTTIFRTLADTVQKARKTIDNETKATGKAIASNMKAGTSAAEREYAKLVAEVTGEGGSMMTKPGDAIKKFAADAKQDLKVVGANFDAMAREASKAMDRMQKATPKSLMSRVSDAVGPTAKAAMGYGRTALNLGARIGGDLARGAGVDVDFTSQMSKGVALQTTLTNLVNSGFMPGAAGANGQRQDAGAIGKELSKTASETGFATNDAAEGLAAFVGKTGDLETGRAVFKDLAVLSKATGTNLEDMVDAAADVSNGLGDIPDKGKRIQEVMRAIAGEGKLGAVEIRDLASQMAKISASAGQIGGDTGTNIAVLGMLTQESRAKGGSASATQAATSTSSFMNTFSKGARLDAFKTFGVNVHDDKGLLLDPREIIKNAIRAASTKQGGMKNFNENMGDMFKDVRARSVTKGFETTFLQAGGGEAGMQAVSAEMEKLTSQMMGQGEVLTSFNAALNTTASQANILNNQLQENAATLSSSLQPALLALTPALMSVTTKLAGLGVGIGNALKKFGVGEADPEVENDPILAAQKEAFALKAKQKSGTDTQADYDHLAGTQAALAKANASKWGEVNVAKKSDGASLVEKAAATAFDQSAIGRIANHFGGKDLGADYLDRQKGGLGQKEQQLSQIETAQMQVDKVLKVHVINQPKPGLTQPANKSHPVNAQP